MDQDDTTPDLIAAITFEMVNDDDNQSRELLALYDTSSKAEQELIDRVLIYLCGYSLPTLRAAAAGGEA